MMSFTSFLFVVLSLSAKSLAAPAVSVAIDVDLSAAAIAPAATSLLASSASSIIAAAASATAVSDVSTTCTNSAYDRRCWGNGYNINTNWYEDWPDTGVIREYWLVVQNQTAAPDGYETQVLTYNGTIPGPTLTANWGDTFVVHVQNNLETNGTNTHWHGIRQLNTNMYDGTAGLTECPIPPGHSHTYTFQATQYGSSWYHSHFSVQYGDGLFGAMVVNGPATSPYDIDLGPIILADWSHSGSTALLEGLVDAGKPDTLDGGLINGTGVFPCSSSDPKCLGTGKYFETTFQHGEIHRLRLVNAGTQSYFRFSIDDHNLTIIANDWVPLKPYKTQFIVLAPGQRYDVLVNANQKKGNYWLRAAYVECYYNELSNAEYNVGIVRYANQNATNAVAQPNSTASAAALSSVCETDEISDILNIPWLALDAGPAAATELEYITHNTSAGLSVLLWQMNGSSFMVDWAYPTISQLYDGQQLEYLSNGSRVNYNDTPPRFELDHIYNGQILVAEDIIQMPLKDQWVYFVLQSEVGLWHPMHLHGHDMYVLASGIGTYSSTNVALNLDNPPRRDVVNLLPFGYLVIAWKTDNPGIWNLHCHIVWHVSQGFAVQIIERESEILAWYDKAVLDQTCVPWGTYAETAVFGEDDSGF